MKTKHHLDVPLKIKSITDDSGEFEGYGSIFGNKDSYDDIVIKGAFSKTLKNWRERGQKPSFLWQHKIDEPIGVLTDIKEDDNGLFIKGQLLIEDDPLARRAHAHMKAGSLRGLSIGYFLDDYEYDSEKGAFILKEIDLYEISLVTFPANHEARISNVKNMLTDTGNIKPKRIEAILRDAGLSRAQAKAFIAKGYSAISQRDVEVERAFQAIKNIKFN